jgi:hypothetical protein
MKDFFKKYIEVILQKNIIDIANYSECIWPARNIELKMSFFF